jgi:hypothetical protein
MSCFKEFISYLIFGYLVMLFKLWSLYSIGCNRKMIINGNERTKKEAVMAYFRNYSRIHLEGQRKTTKHHNQGSQYSNGLW